MAEVDELLAEMVEALIPIGSLIEVSKGDAAIRGRFVSYEFFGFPTRPQLAADPEIGFGYKVGTLVAQQGWSLNILESPETGDADDAR